MKKYLVFGALALTGCSIVQQVQPVQANNLTDVCIIDNPNTRDGFIKQYQSSLQSRGYGVKVVPATASFIDCPMMTTYEGRWNWDLALYMSYAKLNVFINGKPVGGALYDSTRGGGRMDKFIDAETKIDELVGQLYPKLPNHG